MAVFCYLGEAKFALLVIMLRKVPHFTEHLLVYGHGCFCGDWLLYNCTLPEYVLAFLRCRPETTNPPLIPWS